MADAPASTRLTLAEFHELYTRETREGLFELIDGEVVEKMPTFEHGYLVNRISFFLNLYFEERGEITNLGPEIRLEIPGDDENSRLPELAVFEQDQPIQPRGAVTIMPLIAVEVQSPDDSRDALRSRAEYYLAHGAKQTWIVYPKPRKIEVMTLDDASIFAVGDTIDADDVLPGFKLEVAKVFNYPKTE